MDNSQKLRQLRQSLGWPKRKICRLLEISRPTLDKWESDPLAATGLAVEGAIHKLEKELVKP